MEQPNQSQQNLVSDKHGHAAQFIPLDEVDHDISGRGSLDLGVDVLPRQPRADVALDLRLARLVEVVPVLRRQRPEQVVGRRVVTPICEEDIEFDMMSPRLGWSITLYTTFR